MSSWLLILGVALVATGVVALVFAVWPGYGPSNVPFVGLYTAFFGNEGTNGTLWSDEIPYTRVGDQIVITTGVHWVIPTSTVIGDLTTPMQLTLPTAAKNVMINYVSTSGIPFTPPANGLVGWQSSPTTVAFRYAQNGQAVSPTHNFTGADVVHDTTQIIGFVLTYTVA